jgi:hypothetical protein
MLMEMPSIYPHVQLMMVILMLGLVLPKIDISFQYGGLFVLSLYIKA